RHHPRFRYQFAFPSSGPGRRLGRVVAVAVFPNKASGQFVIPAEIVIDLGVERVAPELVDIGSCGPAITANSPPDPPMRGHIQTVAWRGRRAAVAAIERVRA